MCTHFAGAKSRPQTLGAIMRRPQCAPRELVAKQRHVRAVQLESEAFFGLVRSFCREVLVLGLEIETKDMSNSCTCAGVCDVHCAFQAPDHGRSFRRGAAACSQRRTSCVCVVGYPRSSASAMPLEMDPLGKKFGELCLGPPARCPSSPRFWLGGFPFKKVPPNKVGPNLF